ncbi:hypothetical protein Peur_016280 [Populus x canadensis]
MEAVVAVLHKKEEKKSKSTCISPKEVLPTNQFFFTEHFSSMTDSDRTWPS